MNGSETILAVIACCTMLAAVLMAAFAYRLNEMWTEKEAKWFEIAEKQNEILRSTNCTCEKQNELVQRMGEEWLKFYNELRRKDDGRD
jgi:hypothetical protein